MGQVAVVAASKERVHRNFSQNPMSKISWKQLITTKITAHYEKYLRSLSESNSRMEYLNTNLLGLTGRQHPAIQNIHSSWEVRISRPHVKFLSGNYLTYAIKSEQSGGSARCRMSVCIGSSKHEFTY